MGNTYLTYLLFRQIQTYLTYLLPPGVVRIQYVFERIYFLRKYRRIQRIYKVGPTYFPTRHASERTGIRLGGAKGAPAYMGNTYLVYLEAGPNTLCDQVIR